MVRETRVESYSGYVADERPLRFTIAGEWQVVEEVLDRWRTPEEDAWRIRTGRGERFVLRRLGQQSRWTAEAVGWERRNGYPRPLEK